MREPHAILAHRFIHIQISIDDNRNVVAFGCSPSASAREQPYEKSWHSTWCAQFGSASIATTNVDNKVHAFRNDLYFHQFFVFDAKTSSVRSLTPRQLNFWTGLDKHLRSCDYSSQRHKILQWAYEKSKVWFIGKTDALLSIVNIRQKPAWALSITISQIIRVWSNRLRGAPQWRAPPWIFP